MTLFDLSGKVALVTGSSRGIGRAIAGALAAAGASVVVSGRSQPACDAVAAEIEAVNDRPCSVGFAADISSKSDLRALVEQGVAALGPIDILVCNAASGSHEGPLTSIDDAAFRRLFEDNVLSTLWLVAMVAPGMTERRGGSIIIISSVGGLIGSANIGAYNITKAADLQLVRNLAVEYGSANVRVNAIAPGVVRTNFAKMLWEDPQAEAALARARPLGRIGEPDDIAGVAVFLAASASAYVTGQTIVVDGGMMVRGTS